MVAVNPHIQAANRRRPTADRAFPADDARLAAGVRADTDTDADADTGADVDADAADGGTVPATPAGTMAVEEVARAHAACPGPKPDGDAAGRRIVGAGTGADEWQAWPGLAALPAIDVRELVPPGGRAVIVAPHPDDELLGCGGLLQLLAAQETALLLVAVTDGGASHPESSSWPRARLLAERPRETAEALGVLGLGGVKLHRLGLPDGAVMAHSRALRDRLAGLLRPGDVVFVTWRRDGHPDHEACGHAAASAAVQCGATLVELPIWGWHWAGPGDTRVPWQRAYRLALPAPVLARKRAALASYRSQLAPDPSTGRAPILAAGALERLLQPYEIYFV